MFEIMYLIFLTFVVIVAVAVSIYEIKARKNAENAFWRECEAAKTAKSEADILEGKCVGLVLQCDSMKNSLVRATADDAVLRRQLEEALKAREACTAANGLLEKDNYKLINANNALKERNFDDMMSLFECIQGEGGKEYYEKDGICLIVENGKCVGYYRPHGEDACEREECVEETSYEAPAAETVEAEEH